MLTGGTSYNPFMGVDRPAATNPYLGQNPNAYIGDLTQSIARSVIPQVQSGFAGAGRSGESPVAQQTMARGVADALAPYTFGSAEAAQQRQFTGGEAQAGRQLTADQAALERLYSGGEAAAGRQFAAGESGLNRALSAYGSERDRQMQALGLSPSIEAARYAPAQAMLETGAMRDALSQAQLSDQVARWDFAQNQPTVSLENYLQAISGGYGGTTQSSGVSPISTTYPGQNIFGGAMRAFGK